MVGRQSFKSFLTMVSIYFCVEIMVLSCVLLSVEGQVAGVTQLRVEGLPKLPAYIVLALRWAAVWVPFLSIVCLNSTDALELLVLLRDNV
jgi:hypothetical protein